MAAQLWRKALKRAVNAWIEGLVASDPMVYAASVRQTSESDDAIDVPVLIVGAGPTGLVASCLLARLGVRSVTVERHPGTALYPRALGINTRSMEIFRSLGLEAAVRRAAFHVDTVMARSATLMDPRPEVSPSFATPSSDASPSEWTTCPQIDLEPILLHEAASHPEAELRFNTQMISLRPVADGVHACIQERTSGRRTKVRCRYLLAADGARSSTRQLLGIGLQGPGELGHNVNIHFTAPLAERLPHPPFFMHRVENERVRGLFFPTGERRWVLVLGYSPESGESADDFTEERCIELVRAGSGVANLPVEIVGISPWTAQGDVATRWRNGSAFLAGDAAHRMTPAGALGMNTGIQDAHNLAWKLAAVLQGWAGEDLLDTYESERRPVACANMERTVMLLTHNMVDTGHRTARDFDLGFDYASGALIPDGTLKTQTDGDYAPSARPGRRLPHAWVTVRGRRVSTLDLSGPYFTVLVEETERRWRDATRSIAKRMRLPVQCAALRTADATTLHDIMGISQTGAVLVRPDGHVAWRCAELAADMTAADVAADLGVAIRRVLSLAAPTNGAVRTARRDEHPAAVLLGAD